LYFLEFVEALVRVTFLQRKEGLENGMSDLGGLSSMNISKDLEGVIQQMKAHLPRKI
jgi:hypothetical protein